LKPNERLTWTQLNASTSKACSKPYVRQALDQFRRLGMKRELADAEALLAKLSEGSQQS